MSSEIPETVALGKKAYVADPKTLKMAHFMLPEISVPSSYSVDAHRKPFPSNLWGNDHYGDCVFATRANQQLRFERIEQRRTIPLTDQTVIDEYLRRTSGKDEGYVMLYANREWRNEGWKIGVRNYNIFAYGELEPHNHEQLRQGIYVLAGIQFGFSLPVAIQRQQNWIYNGETGGEWEPGSWGGHAVYGLAYDQQGVTVKTWGYNCKVNWNFIDKYADESWAVVDNADSWRIKQTIDVKSLSEKLGQISSYVNQ
jgi:hypothetical protein